MDCSMTGLFRRVLLVLLHACLFCVQVKHVTMLATADQLDPMSRWRFSVCTPSISCTMRNGDLEICQWYDCDMPQILPAEAVLANASGVSCRIEIHVDASIHATESTALSQKVLACPNTALMLTEFDQQPLWLIGKIRLHAASSSSFHEVRLAMIRDYIVPYVHVTSLVID